MVDEGTGALLNKIEVDLPDTRAELDKHADLV